MSIVILICFKFLVHLDKTFTGLFDGQDILLYIVAVFEIDGCAVL